MSDRTVKLQHLRHQIDSSLAVVESCAILSDWAAAGSASAVDADRQRERDSIAARECARAKQLIEKFIEAAA